ncbi:unnamed protein product [Fraxinus pennsylvanica]|uniref:Pentatricopeptide repeat-containing protein n=1 Tax=Fraxinus pennsylvanica TaxID=56036 RepID=A0AAD2DSM7_9LAMI|nr:unnamed protein product [Fraxinus pennsylvanica]
MLKSSYRPGSSTFQRILTELVKQGSALESAILVILMLKKQIKQNISLSTDTVKLLFTSGMLDRAFEVVRRFYENVLMNLCKAHRASEAVDLYYKMLEKGIQQPLGCIEDLRSTLEAQGKLKEAEFVTKRMPSSHV